MKKTSNIDDKLLREAKRACGAATDTEAVRQGLEALVRRDAYQRLKALGGQRAGCARRATAPALAKEFGVAS
jgi:Arc/MetJ family transcription regulator